MKTAEQSIESYISALSSKAAVPGGGGASALAGAYGVSLGLMVCELTHGKKKYAEFEPELARIMEKLTAIRGAFISLSDEDEAVFLPLSKAYGLPKETEEQQLLKEQTLESCLLTASLTPIKVMEKACEALNYMQALAENGSKLALSDVGVGVQFLNTALTGAIMNLYINTKMMKDTGKAAELNDYAERLLEDGTHQVYAVYELVEKTVKPVFAFKTRQRHDKVDFE